MGLLKVPSPAVVHKVELYLSAVPFNDTVWFSHISLVAGAPAVGPGNTLTFIRSLAVLAQGWPEFTVTVKFT